jgi:hypothetical protein
MHIARRRVVRRVPVSKSVSEESDSFRDPELPGWTTRTQLRTQAIGFVQPDRPTHTRTSMGNLET